MVVCFCFNYLLQSMLRVCCLRRFGYFISQMKSISFSYDASRTTFIGPQQAVSEILVVDTQAERKLVSFLTWSFSCGHPGRAEISEFFNVCLDLTDDVFYQNEWKTLVFYRVTDQPRWKTIQFWWPIRLTSILLEFHRSLSLFEFLVLASYLPVFIDRTLRWPEFQFFINRNFFVSPI